MGGAEEMVGIRAVVTDQAEQRRSVAYPVILADGGRLVLVDAEMALDVLGHRAVDVGKMCGVA